jgi:hypothetical protein
VEEEGGVDEVVERKRKSDETVLPNLPLFYEIRPNKSVVGI